MITRSTAILGIAILGAALMAGCGKGETEAKPVIRPVRYQTVYASESGRVRTFTGTAAAGLESKLSFKVSGTVRKVAVKVGDKVKAGALIAGLDPSDYKLQEQEAEASLEQAEAQSRNAKANYERIRSLYENRNASRNDLDASRAAFESADAQVRSIEKRLELAHSQLKYTSLKAPTDGAIAAVEIEANENVSAGIPVVILTSGKRPEVKVDVPESLITQIVEGSKVEVTFDALPGETLSAVVTEVGVTTAGRLTTFPVTVKLEEPNPAIRPGMAAEVAIHFGSTSDRTVFIVPTFSVGEDREGRYIFVVEPAGEGLGMVHRRDVVIGEILEEGLEVMEGLSDGDRLVTAGVSRIHDGMKVRLLEGDGE